jgi:hypothetical protein
VTVVLPLVPVTPYMRSRVPGSPWTRAATAPSTARGSGTTSAGSPVPAASREPSGSVSTATAPASAAGPANRAPWVRAPGSAA